MSQPVVFLEAPYARVYLRPVEKNDLPFFRQVLNDEKIARFLAGHHPLMEMEEEEWYTNLPKRKSTNRVFSIILKENNELIGITSLHDIEWINQTATTGTFIGKDNLLGKGYGTEAKMLLLKYAFLGLNLRQVYSKVLGFNERSLKYAQRCGYREVGRYPDSNFRDGVYHDLVHLVVIRAEWSPLWEQFQAQTGAFKPTGKRQ